MSSDIIPQLIPKPIDMQQTIHWFFFGSLMDPDVLAAVIGRTLPADRFEPAVLRGYRRIELADESYPALIAQPGARVAGVVVTGLDREDARRIRFFEGEDEFDLQRRSVELADGRSQEAWVFTGGAAIKPTERDWDYGAWRRLHKPEFLRLTRAFMAGYGNTDWQALDAAWRSARAALGPDGKT